MCVVCHSRVATIHKVKAVISVFIYAKENSWINNQFLIQLFFRITSFGCLGPEWFTISEECDNKSQLISKPVLVPVEGFVPVHKTVMSVKRSVEHSIFPLLRLFETCLNSLWRIHGFTPIELWYLACKLLGLMGNCVFFFRYTTLNIGGTTIVSHISEKGR